LSYQTGPADAIRNAGRFLKETGIHAVKLEGAGPAIDTVRALVEVGIPVMGHLGFTPQSVHRLGSQVVQARTEAEAATLVDDAMPLEAAGAFAVVLECIPAEVAREASTQLAIPTIGIGAGRHCDGQILVFHDLVGLTTSRLRFVKQYAALAEVISDAV